ncbi:uncharacterized protein BDZ99DRAFT_475269 [Mytilinidion resinicola]|uniref:RRM domain-containing protein n=1 Tax=Mytilinidion resinicola TaxID=574789 RepID=A0A6A6YTQ1_9PEZI|nr:uncharacterized protein BDZ99DRAFT_475269 [Mytilinidion resinicola]KAF2811753.1 hypothetical protein BDZ99DRAFT_475269 [Mytilinidion resinicola]
MSSTSRRKPHFEAPFPAHNTVRLVPQIALAPELTTPSSPSHRDLRKPRPIARFSPLLSRRRPISNSVSTTQHHPHCSSDRPGIDNNNLPKSPAHSPYTPRRLPPTSYRNYMSASFSSAQTRPFHQTAPVSTATSSPAHSGLASSLPLSQRKAILPSLPPHKPARLVLQAVRPGVDNVALTTRSSWTGGPEARRRSEHRSAERNRQARAEGPPSNVSGVPFHCICVGNVHFSITETDLNNVFERFGGREFVQLQKEETDRIRDCGSDDSARQYLRSVASENSETARHQSQAAITKNPESFVFRTQALA